MLEKTGGKREREERELDELARLRERVAHLERALESRVRIEQAKGYLAARYSIDLDEAFTVLRFVARNSGRNLQDVAADTVRGQIGSHDRSLVLAFAQTARQRAAARSDRAEALTEKSEALMKQSDRTRRRSALDRRRRY